MGIKMVGEYDVGPTILEKKIGRDVDNLKFISNVINASEKKLII